MNTYRLKRNRIKERDEDLHKTSQMTDDLKNNVLCKQLILRVLYRRQGLNYCT